MSLVMPGDRVRERSVYLGEDYDRAANGLYLPPKPPRIRDRPVAVELFAGAGGFGLGFHLAGWHVAAAVEYDLPAALTYLTNLGGPDTIIHVDSDLLPKKSRSAFGGRKDLRASDPLGFPAAGTGWISHRGEEQTGDFDQKPAADEPAVEHFWIADVRNLTGAEILDALGMQIGEVDCVFGGPPCQGFSGAGMQDVMDPRNSLVFDFARIVLEIMPKTMVMENVPGMVRMRTPEGLPVIDALALVLSKGGMGTREALTKTLLATSGAGAITKSLPVSKGAQVAADEENDDAEPGTLFELEAS